MAWSTFFFLFTISSFRAWTESQTGVIPLQAAPAPPARDAKESTACSHLAQEGCNRSDPSSAAERLTGISGTKVSKHRAKIIANFQVCTAEELPLEKSFAQPSRSRSRPASLVASLAWKPTGLFTFTFLEAASSLLKARGGQACTDIAHKATETCEASPGKPLFGASVTVSNTSSLYTSPSLENSQLVLLPAKIKVRLETNGKNKTKWINATK